MIDWQQGTISLFRFQQGHTLLELMLVVSISAILVASSISLYLGGSKGGVRSQTKMEAARFEMSQLRKALLQYKRDNHAFPLPGTQGHQSPADLSFLMLDTNGSADNDWNPEYRRGWRGPYLTEGDSGLVDIGDALKAGNDFQVGPPELVATEGGAGKPYLIETAPYTLQRGMPDPFRYPPVLAYGDDDQLLSYSARCEETVDNNRCLLDWRLVNQGASNAPQKKMGRPYLLFDLHDNSKARIVSMGSNGVYDSSVIPGSLRCATRFTAQGENDDLVLCLY